MRMLLKWTAAPILGLLLCAPARAAQVEFTGTLSIEIEGLPAIPIQGSGSVGFSLDAQGALTALTIPVGAFATAVTVPVPNAFPIIQARLAGPGGVGSLQNRRIAVSSGATCTAGHPNVVCPGGGLAGFGGLSGSAIVGLSSTHTAGSGTGPVANLPVPLSVVGGGSTATGVTGTVSGAGWTTGAVSIVNPTGTGTTATVRVTGSRNTSPGRGTQDGQLYFDHEQISLVSPVQIFDTATNEFSSSVARLTLTLTPEPSAPLLLFSALAVLAALYGARRLRC